MKIAKKIVATAEHYCGGIIGIIKISHCYVLSKDKIFVYDDTVGLLIDTIEVTGKYTTENWEEYVREDFNEYLHEIIKDDGYDALTLKFYY